MGGVNHMASDQIFSMDLKLHDANAMVTDIEVLNTNSNPRPKDLGLVSEALVIIRETLVIWKQQQRKRAQLHRRRGNNMNL